MSLEDVFKEFPPDENGNISLADAIRLKHKLGLEIRFAGKSVPEIENLKTVSADEYAAARIEFRAYMKSCRFLNTLAVNGIFLAGIACLFFPGWPRYAGIAAMAYAFHITAKWATYEEAFLHGYGDGLDHGVDKALGLTEADLNEIGKLSTDLRADKMMVDALDRKKDNQTNE